MELSKAQNWIEIYEYLDQADLKAKHEKWDNMAKTVAAEGLVICDSEVRDQQKRVKQLK